MIMRKCQFNWWRKPEHPEETTDQQQVTHKLSHIGPVPVPVPGQERKLWLKLAKSWAKKLFPLKSVQNERVAIPRTLPDSEYT